MKILTKKMLIGFTALTLIIGGSAAYLLFPLNASPQVENIKEVKVRQGTLQLDMEADGKTELSVVRLKFAGSGVLRSVPVKLGAAVKKGDVIAELDTTTLQYEVANARAYYQSASAKLEDARIQNENNVLSELNKLNSARLQRDKEKLEYEFMLAAAESYSQRDLDDQKGSLDSAEANYQLAQKLYETALNSSTKVEEAAAAQAKAALDKALRNLADGTLKSPVDGKIVALNYKIGETVSSGSDFALVSDSGGMQVMAQVLELDIRAVFVDQQVEIELESHPAQTFTGRVNYIDTLPINDPNGVVAYNAIINMDSPDEDIRSGATGLVNFIIEQKKNVLIIPNEAVKIVEGKQAVEVRDKAGNISVRWIKTGFTEGKNSEVVNGLQEGETVIIRTAVSGA